MKDTCVSSLEIVKMDPKKMKQNTEKVKRYREKIHKSEPSKYEERKKKDMQRKQKARLNEREKLNYRKLCRRPDKEDLLYNTSLDEEFEMEENTPFVLDEYVAHTVKYRKRPHVSPVNDTEVKCQTTVKKRKIVLKRCHRRICPIPLCEGYSCDTIEDFDCHWLNVHVKKRKLWTCIPCMANKEEASFLHPKLFLEHLKVNHHCNPDSQNKIAEESCTVNFEINKTYINPENYSYKQSSDYYKMKVVPLHSVTQEKASEVLSEVMRFAQQSCKDYDTVLNDLYMSDSNSNSDSDTMIYDLPCDKIKKMDKEDRCIVENSTRTDKGIKKDKILQNTSLQIHNTKDTVDYVKGLKEYSSIATVSPQEETADNTLHMQEIDTEEDNEYACVMTNLGDSVLVQEELYDNLLMEFAECDPRQSPIKELIPVLDKDTSKNMDNGGKYSYTGSKPMDENMTNGNIIEENKCESTNLTEFVKKNTMEVGNTPPDENPAYCRINHMMTQQSSALRTAQQAFVSLHNTLIKAQKTNFEELIIEAEDAHSSYKKAIEENKVFKSINHELKTQLDNEMKANKDIESTCAKQTEELAEYYKIKRENETLKQDLKQASMHIAEMHDLSKKYDETKSSLEKAKEDLESTFTKKKKVPTATLR